MATEATRALSRERPGAEPVLRVRELTKSFHRGPPWHRRAVEILRGASLEVGRGELVGLVGENGSGKSVIVQIVVGAAAARRGHGRRAGAARLLPTGADALGQAHRRGALPAVQRGLPPLGGGRGPLARRAARRAVFCQVPRLSRRGALGRHAPEAEPRARAAPPAGPAPARRALRRVRLGDLPALLGDGGAPTERGHGRAGRQPPAVRARAPHPGLRAARRAL